MINKKKIIASLTTTSERLDAAYLVICDILDGEITPDKIVLSISHTPYLYDKGINSIPQKFRDIGNILDIVSVENVGPHRKYLYVFETYKNDIVVLVDDDMRKNKYFLKNLLSAYASYPFCIISSTGNKLFKKGEEWHILDYMRSMVSGMWRDLAVWCGMGTLIDMSLIKDIDLLCDTKKIKELAPTSSEVWLNAYFRVKNLPIFLIRPIDAWIGGEIVGSQEKALKQIHIKNQEQKNDMFLACQRYFKETLQ